MANEIVTLEALRYNPALLASAANSLVFQATDVARVVSATVQQAQMNRLSTDVLQGQTINKMFDFLNTAAQQKGMQLLIKKSVDLHQFQRVSQTDLQACQLYICARADTQPGQTWKKHVWGLTTWRTGKQ